MGHHAGRCEPEATGCSLWDGERRLLLHTEVPLQLREDQATAAFTVRAGEQAHHGGQPERHSYRPVD